MDKTELRKEIKKKRKTLNMRALSLILADKLTKTAEYQNAKNIMLYYPLEDEVNLLSLLDDKTKYFYLPRINDKELECCSYKTGDELCDSCFHTKEPVCSACSKTSIDLAIIPALACDNKNYRLGYGGGFYDRFLKDFKGIKIVCIPSELVLNTIYRETHDIPMDIVITESTLF